MTLTPGTSGKDEASARRTGLEESDLANDLKKVARPLAIEVLSDPEPERNAFVRSDQYSFIRTGVPFGENNQGGSSPSGILARLCLQPRFGSAPEAACP